MPSSFETVGHIAHLNLREELLPHKHTIGQVCGTAWSRLEQHMQRVRMAMGKQPARLLAGSRLRVGKWNDVACVSCPCAGHPR